MYFDKGEQRAYCDSSCMYIATHSSYLGGNLVNRQQLARLRFKVF